MIYHYPKRRFARNYNRMNEKELAAWDDRVNELIEHNKKIVLARIAATTKAVEDVNKK